MIQHAFSKPSLVNLISKDANLVFYLSLYKSIHYSTRDHDVIIEFPVDSMSLTTSFKKKKMQRHSDLIKAYAVR